MSVELGMRTDWGHYIWVLLGVGYCKLRRGEYSDNITRC
jgi:hypothetical protein